MFGTGKHSGSAHELFVSHWRTESISIAPSHIQDMEAGKGTDLH